MTRLLPILVLLCGCTTDAQIDAFASRMESAVLAYEQSQERMAAEIRSAALPPFPEDAPQPKLGWDQDAASYIVAWHIYLESISSVPSAPVPWRTVFSQRCDLPENPGITKLTITAVDFLGRESEPSEPFFITNTPPITNIVIEIVARLMITNPAPAQEFFALASTTNLAQPVWRPAPAAVTIEKREF
jgi:hypothetical protein